MAKNGEAEKEGRRASRKGEEPQARELEEILQKLREARNFDFRSYKRATLYRRVLRRMQDHGKSTLAEYSALLDSHPAEYDALLSSMFIKVTSFFRDKDTWDELSKRVIPQMLAEKRPGEEIRAWCAGCATGEEAFSLALTLAEVLGPSFANQDVKVLGAGGEGEGDPLPPPRAFPHGPRREHPAPPAQGVVRRGERRLHRPQGHPSLRRLRRQQRPRR